MTNSSPDALWDECLALIRGSVTEQQYKAWFEPIVFKSFDSGTKTVLVQVDRFVYEVLEQNHVELLTRVLTQVFCNDVKLTYRVTDSGRKGTEIPSDMPEKPLPDARARETGRQGQPKTPQLNPQLDMHLTFKNYIEGESNKLPRTVGLSIAEHPHNMQFNPFFVYGPSGCGKTHLINAIGVRTLQIYPQKRVLCVSARLFEVQYTNAVLQNKINDFINFYQTIDLLIVDDIQEWEDKKGTQNTFFHIFNHLFLNGKRIILASDRPPVELKGVTDRLLTRFSCGLIAELEKPNAQLCVDILKNKIRRDGLSIPDDVIAFVAQTANGSVRDLHGVINSLMAYSVVYNCNINMRLAERVIKRAVKVDDEPLTVDDILESVCSHYDVTQAAIMGRSRKRDIVMARQVSVYLAQKYTKMPSSRIGRLIGGRDHSTVIYSCSQVEQRMKVDPTFADDVGSIEASFKLKR